MRIRKGQIWKHKDNDQQLLIKGKKGDKWNAVVLTTRAGIFNGSHKMTEYILVKKFDLVG